jgi:hypothetical protein
MSGPFAASAKNGSPIEIANSPSSQSASPEAGGLPHPLAMCSGSAKHAMTVTQRWTMTDIRPGAKRVSAWA